MRRVRSGATGTTAFFRLQKLLIVDSDLYYFSLKTDKRLEFLAFMLEIDLVNLLPFVSFLFNFGNSSTRICFPDDIFHLFFAKKIKIPMSPLGFFCVIFPSGLIEIYSSRLMKKSTLPGSDSARGSRYSL